MKMRRYLWIGVVGLALLASETFASTASATPAATSAASQSAADAVVAKLRALRPDLLIESASAAPIPGMVQIELTGGNMLYASNDGRYLISGDLYEVGKTLVNVAEQARDAKRKKLIAGVPLADMAIFPAQGRTKAVITVFTDVDCGYCRKLHKEVPALNGMGVEVRYLAYPRAGIGSPGYKKMVTAWCSSDRDDTITRMKRGEEFPPKTCKNPVAHEYELGQLAGLTGTPAIVLEDGSMIDGYVSADQLKKTLGI